MSQVSAPPSPKVRSTGTFRPEIEGLRTVAAFLVAIYHVWFDRVSGGVDIFFVVSGFLITGSLVRQYERDLRINVGAYLRRIARRILPSAYLVLTVVLAASAFIISRAFHAVTFSDIAAASAYVSNHKFAADAVDYLAQDQPQSVVLHFWALSIQGQFYLVWPLFIIVVAALAKYRRFTFRKTLMVATSGVFVVSLAYSMYLTTTNQQVAYFSTSARAWEFALGGMLALGLHRIRIGPRLGVLLASVALGAILSVGALLDVAEMFPGYAALIPTLSAVAIIVAGDSGVRSGPIALLSARPMQYLGGVSYAFFLWHWPVFILTKTHFDVDRLGFLAGAVVLAISFVLALASTRLLEQPIRRAGSSRPKFSRLEASVYALVPASLIVLAFAFGQTTTVDALDLEQDEYLGAEALGEGSDARSWDEFNDPDLPIVPDPVDAGNDQPAPYEDDCHQTQTDPEPITCSYGAEDGEQRIFLIGGSHATHWQPTLDIIGQQRGWEIVNVTKSSCRFDDSEEDESCIAWNARVIDLLAEESPDAVITTATIGFEGEDESIPDGFIRQWEQVEALDIPVIAIRDNPWFGTGGWGVQVPECVVDEGPDSPECALERSTAFASDAPWITAADQVPETVQFIDLTDQWCTEETCWPVIGNVLVYRDGHHFTVAFAQTLAPALDEELQQTETELFE